MATKITLNATALTDRQILNRLKKMDALKREADALKEEAENIRSGLIAALGQCDISNDLFRLKYTEYQSRGLDTKKLKSEMPELWERFPKTSQTSRFTYEVK